MLRALGKSELKGRRKRIVPSPWERKENEIKGRRRRRERRRRNSQLPS